MNTDLIAYYKKRALEYERIYSKPERQDAIKAANKSLQTIFKDKKVYEIACGTGFWTQTIAATAESVIATDINRSVIEIAEQKTYEKNNVTFKVEDIFSPASVIKHENFFGGFIWSHISLQDLNSFLTVIHNSTKVGGTIVFMDNKYVEGSNHPITHTDEHGNTFQSRKLDDGTSHLVLKNFPDEKSLRDRLSGLVAAVEYIDLKYFWLLRYNNV